MAYPATINALTVKSDGPTQIIYAAYPNAIRTALLDLVTVLGNAPQGNKASLEERLDVRIDDDGKLKHPSQFVTVGKTNADYTTIQAAIDAISDAAEDKRYTALVNPGKYDEAVTLKDYVDLVGVSPYSTIIACTTHHAITIPANAHCSIKSIQATASLSMRNAIDMGGTSLLVQGCILDGVGQSIEIDAGDAVIFHSQLSTGGFKHRGSAGTSRLFGCLISTPSRAALTVQTGTVYINNSTLLSDSTFAIVATGGTFEFACSTAISANYDCIELTDVSPKFSNSILKSGGATEVIGLVTTDSNPTLTNCKLVALPQGPSVITAAAENTNVKVALCAMNGAIGGNCNNLIGTPYNVIDPDID